MQFLTLTIKIMPWCTILTYQIYSTQRAKQKCEKAQCPYGIMKYRDDRSRCIECYCNEPCYGHECPIPGTKCAVEAVKSRSGQSSNSAPEYR